MISYCIASYRPKYSQMLIDDLIRKTNAPFEILVWINIGDPGFEEFLAAKQANGVPLRVVGATPENIGMRAYPLLFGQAKHQMVVQIDDDVIAVSPGIAEQAQEIFRRNPQVKQLVADVWQDEYTTGARPPMSLYRPYRPGDGLFHGPIDGWFSVFHRSVLPLVHRDSRADYFPLGGQLQQRLKARGEMGLLCTKFKVFHVIGPEYASYFDMLEFEIEKYRRLGRTEIVAWYTDAKRHLPSKDHLRERIEGILEHLASWPSTPGDRSH